MMRDDNAVPLTSLDSFECLKIVPSAFAGGTTNARGDDGGTNDPYTIATVTGDVLVGIYGVCTTDLASAGGGTVSLGITSNVTLFNGATTATAIDEHEVWTDTSPAIGKPLDALSFYILGNGQDIVEAIATADVTSGNIYYVVLWRPLTVGSTLVAAV